MKRIIMIAAALAVAGCWNERQQAREWGGAIDNPVAIDGDTFRAERGGDQYRFRLARIDAPEMPGHCRAGRLCVQGDPYASKRALQGLLNSEDEYGRGVYCASRGRDFYRRVLVECWVGTHNLSDIMLATHLAEGYRR